MEEIAVQLEFTATCGGTDHVFTHETRLPGHKDPLFWLDDEIPLGTICDCGMYYWDGAEMQLMSNPHPCGDCGQFPRAPGADWCLDCEWSVAYDAAHPDQDKK